MSNKSKDIVADLLDLADVKINGNRPWDIQVHEDKLYPRVLSGGSLSLGESYMDGWWDSESLDQFFYQVLKAELDKKITGFKNIIRLGIRALVLNLQAEKRAYDIGEKHYDIGNDLYQSMLDKRMNYSCGYWSNSTKLDDAQESKLELADLLEEFRLQLLPHFFLLRPATGKKLGQLFHQMLSPQPDLVGMDAELARDLGDRLLPLGRFKYHFGLERRIVRLPHTRNHTIPPWEIWQAQNPLIPPAQDRGAFQITLINIDCPEYRRRTSLIFDNGQEFNSFVFAR